MDPQSELTSANPANSIANNRSTQHMYQNNISDCAVVSGLGTRWDGIHWRALIHHQEEMDSVRDHSNRSNSKAVWSFSVNSSKFGNGVVPKIVNSFFSSSEKRTDSITRKQNFSRDGKKGEYLLKSDGGWGIFWE